MENPAGVDRISDLSDELLCHILSLLPLKDAFATTVLSKRWSPLRHSFTVLRFDDKAVKGRGDFLSFRRHVDAVMLSLHSVQQIPIKAFHLKCSNSTLWYNDHSIINRWVEAAKRHRVEDLDLSMFNIFQFVPSCLFTLKPNIFSCSTLVALKLSKLRVAKNILSVNLPSLKTLYLEEVTLRNPENLKKLLSNCPILEDLHTHMYYIKAGYDKPLGFETLSKLVRAEINLFDVPFRAISNVEFLRVVKYMERHCVEEINSYYKGFPVFQNLVHLELVFYYFCYGWDDIVEMLQHCPKLQILVIIKEILKSNKHFYTDWRLVVSVPQCVSSHLRSCTITSSCHLEDEIRFAAYILQNARRLQVMTIKSSESLNSTQKDQFLDELSSCSKISPECKHSLEFLVSRSRY